MNNNTVIIHITVHATIWRSTSPAWIVCAQTRTATGGWWASQWCGLSAGNQRQIGQRRWAQIGDDDTGKPDYNQSGVPVLQATQYRRCNQRLINWRRDWTPDAAKVAQRSETPGWTCVRMDRSASIKNPSHAQLFNNSLTVTVEKPLKIFCRRYSMQCPEFYWWT